MGFRISLYCVPNEVAAKYRDFTEEQFIADENIMEELYHECIKYDTLTDVIRSDCGDKFSTKFFTNKLSIEEDLYFGTISKEQLLNIIEDVRENHILKWFDGRRVSEHELGDVWSKINLNGETSITKENAMIANQVEWNLKANSWKHKWKNKKDDKVSHYLNINIDLDNKWIVSGADTYEYLIFDLIHILKIFDWKNNILMCIGG